MLKVCNTNCFYHGRTIVSLQKHNRLLVLNLVSSLFRFIFFCRFGSGTDPVKFSTYVSEVTVSLCLWSCIYAIAGFGLDLIFINKMQMKNNCFCHKGSEVLRFCSEKKISKTKLSFWGKLTKQNKNFNMVVSMV